MSNQFEKLLNKITQDDIEEAQDRDFYMWNEYLKEFPQTLYDIFEGNFSGEELTSEEARYRKAFLDQAYIYLQAAMEDIRGVIKKKYPDADWLNRFIL